MSAYEDYAMRARIDACIKKVTMILESNRDSKVRAAGSASHQYSDKFLLVDSVVSTACVSVVHCLNKLGLTHDHLKTLRLWSANKSITLSFQFTSKSTLQREIESEIEAPTKIKKTSSKGEETIAVVTKVKEFVYLEEQTYQLVAFAGIGAVDSEPLIVTKRSGSTERVRNQRVDDATTSDSIAVNISWLLKVLSPAITAAEFSIDRSRVNCFTPVQNEDTIGAEEFFVSLGVFADAVVKQLRKWRVCQEDLPKITLSESAFSPIVPLFEVRDTNEAVPLSSEVANALLDEYDRHLVKACLEIESALGAQPSASSSRASSKRKSTSSSNNSITEDVLFGAQEAKLQEMMERIIGVRANVTAAIDYVEGMIRSQLVAAIGKKISAEDFAQYMTFHNRKVFKEAYQPKPFSYAVRRSPAHSPEGKIQIEMTGASPATPICTVAQHVENAPFMEFALNATTTVKFGGERYLHGWMAHHFSGNRLPELCLVAEARQFSSYVVLIGRIASAKLFQPKHAFIAQNKDEFRISLELEQIPTAKEFKSAISSLSPEQQRFAKAFRSMQLESTLFGVCVIQIKPQLERVLKLQADSLTKEIKLTQDLMQLFIKHQIPTDLLSFQGQSGDGLVAVKGHAQAMLDVIQSAKEEEVREAELQRDVREQRQRSLRVRCSRGGVAPSRARSAVSCLDNVKLDEEENDVEGDWDEEDDYDYDQKKTAQDADEPTEPLQRSETVATELDDAPAARPQVDYTAYPAKLEEMYTQYDPTSSLRPTIINPGSVWTKRAQAGLLSAPQTARLFSPEQTTEKNAAFDLLDALTQSGALPIEHASLHVVIAATHCFDKSLMDTVVQKNVNPIERVERSTLIMAAALSDMPTTALVTSGQLERVRTYSPMLFPGAAQSDVLMNE